MILQETYLHKPKRRLRPSVFVKTSTIRILICDVKRKFGGSDCGLYALAFAATECAGQNSSKINFIQHKFRDHL